MKKLILLFLAVFVIPFLFVGCGIGEVGTPETAAPVQTTPIQGAKAPDFTLNDIEDHSISLINYLSKNAILVDFSTTWCPHCITIIPKLKNIYNRYRDKGLDVISIYIKEPKEIVEALVKKHDIPYTVLLDSDGAVASSYGVTGIPTIVIIDKKGMIRYRNYTIDDSVIDRIINS